MNLELDKKIIIVTGAKGITEGIIKVLAAENAVPVIVGRNETDNLKALEGVRSKGFQVIGDLIRAEECSSAVQQVVERFGRIDGLINIAGVNDAIDLENGNYAEYVAWLHKNLVQYYLMAHHALPYLKKSKGAIVNIVSKPTDTPHENISAYAASNGGRNALTREWAVELLPYGIRVNAVIVGEKLKSFTQQTPLEKRITTTEEIANTVAFLLSPRSSHTTGQLVHVNGEYVHFDREIS